MKPYVNKCDTCSHFDVCMYRNKININPNVISIIINCRYYNNKNKKFNNNSTTNNVLEIIKTDKKCDICGNNVETLYTCSDCDKNICYDCIGEVEGGIENNIDKYICINCLEKALSKDAEKKDKTKETIKKIFE